MRGVSRDRVIDDRRGGWADFFRLIWYFGRHHRPAYVGLTLFLSLTYIYGFVPPYILGRVVDQFLTDSQFDVRLIAAYAVLLAGSWILVSILRLQTKNELGNLYNEIVYETKVDGFRRLLNFSLTWHQQENTGNKIQRILTGVQNLRQFLFGISRYFLSNFIDMLGVIILFSTLGPLFLLFMLCYAVLFICNELFFQKKIQAANDLWNRAVEQSTGTYVESATNLLTVKTLGIQHKVTAKVSRAEEAAKDHSNQIRALGTRKWKYFQTINGLAYGAFILLMAQQFYAGLLTAGTIFVFYTYFQRLTKAAGDVGEIVVDLIEQKSGIARMAPIFMSDQELDQGSDAFPKTWQTLALTKGWFRYGQKGSFALRDVTLTIRRGEKIGIVGISGSGKSTLAKLFLGLYPFTKGTYTIGDQPVYSIRRDALTRAMSTVLQETELFNLSLKDNLTLFQHVPDELLGQATQIAQLDLLIATLPDGIDTLVGEKGYKLSGGERQRLGIARAICSGAEILILDEATSALDSKTELAIQRGIEEHLTQRTMILIAHRLSTLRHVDRILVFEKGRIIEEGTFAGLLKRTTSRFAELYRLQTQQHQTLYNKKPPRGGRVG